MRVSHSRKAFLRSARRVENNLKSGIRISPLFHDFRYLLSRNLQPNISPLRLRSTLKLQVFPRVLYSGSWIEVTRFYSKQFEVPRKQKPAPIININKLLFQVSLAIWSKVQAHQMLGNAILKRLKWNTRKNKSENLSQQAWKRLYPVWCHMMWTTSGLVTRVASFSRLKSLTSSQRAAVWL